MLLHVQVVTPEKQILDVEAKEIIAPTTSGEITILPQHIPLVTQIAPGELIIKLESKDEHLVVVGGFLEVTPDKVTILADYAAKGDNLSAAAAQEAKERAEKKMKEKLSEKDYAIAEAELRRALLELRVANKYKSSR